MNRKIHLLSLLLLFTGTFTVTSCSDDDSSQTELIDTSNINSFNILKKSSKSSIESANSNIYGEGTLMFKNNESLDFKIIDENTFTYDVEKNGEYNLLVKKENNFFIFYDSNTLEKLGKAELSVNKNVGTLVFTENYITNNTNSILAKGGGWRSCFEGKMGSAEGVTLLALSSFGGPWATAGFVSGVAIGCAL